MKMKLINLDNRASIATVECECGGLTLISTTAVTEAWPNKGRCPVCNETFDYPTDLEQSRGHFFSPSAILFLLKLRNVPE